MDSENIILEGIEFILGWLILIGIITVLLIDVAVCDVKNYIWKVIYMEGQKKDKTIEEMNVEWRRYKAANYSGYDKYVLDRIDWEKFQELLERSVNK